MMGKLIFWGGLLTAYTIWLIVDLIKNKGKSMTKIMLRAVILFIIITGFLILVEFGIPMLSYFNNSAFIIIACVVLLVMIGLFVAPYTNIKKGSEDFKLLIGMLLYFVGMIVIGVFVCTFWY